MECRDIRDGAGTMGSRWEWDRVNYVALRAERPRDIRLREGHTQLAFADGRQPNPQRRLRTRETEPANLRWEPTVETVVGRDLLEPSNYGWREAVRHGR